MPNILIIDDDASISEMLSEALENEGYSVTKAYSGTEAVMILSQSQPDLILLDLMLPGMSGEELLPKIKDIPVIVVSAKADISDKVGLLLGGAADYITKPFDISELLARITVQLRKKINGDGNTIKINDLTLCSDKLTVIVDETEIRLTRTECAIMKLLMQNPGQVFPPKSIYQTIWKETPSGCENTVAVHIRHIREKVEITPAEPRYLKAVWGQGYKSES